MYDKEKVERVVNAKRISFYKKAGLTSFIIVACIVTSFLGFGDRVSFSCLAAVFPLLILLVRICKKYDTKVLFCPEIIGTNIKEYEYSIHSADQHRIFRKGNIPHNYSNKKPSIQRLNGTVYLKLNDGNIKSISGLYKSHMEIYEDGDTLLKYDGAKFPVVINRQAKKQPCPICGEVNDMTLDECRVCGLGIVKNKKSQKATDDIQSCGLMIYSPED